MRRASGADHISGANDLYRTRDSKTLAEVFEALATNNLKNRLAQLRIAEDLIRILLLIQRSLRDDDCLAQFDCASGAPGVAEYVCEAVPDVVGSLDLFDKYAVLCWRNFSTTHTFDDKGRRSRKVD